MMPWITCSSTSVTATPWTTSRLDGDAIAGGIRARRPARLNQVGGTRVPAPKPAQHHEIRAWISAARTPEAIVQMPAGLWRSLELASVLMGVDADLS